MTQASTVLESAPPTPHPPRLILSVATGFGAERKIETRPPRRLIKRRVAVFAGNPLHLERLPRLEIHEMLRQARAMLVTSISDDGPSGMFGRSIIEAWAHGRPAIAFACGAPAQFIRHEVDGLLADESEAQGLADAMERLPNDPAPADWLGRSGGERAEREFATPRLPAPLMDVLEGRSCRHPFTPHRALLNAVGVSL